jgi:K+-sensing histidine kinase KdpD
LDGQAMIELLSAISHQVDRLTHAGILALAACGVMIVGGIDYFTGYEISMSLFYLGPVALAAWYAGRWPGFAIAVLSCVVWYCADLRSGNQYIHPAIPVWNALVRFGFFFITGSLMTSLRENLRTQQHLGKR